MNNARQKVLVIDDELGPRESLRILLKTEYDVYCADSVQKGLELLRSHQPDTIVMDIRMPGMTGIEGLREIRHIDPHVSVIMLTGFGTLESAQEAIRLGANDYLKKPFDTKDMLETIRRNVQRADLNRRRARTERELQDLNRQLVSELASKDRMASLGQASAELVHDLRNPMSVIFGYVQILGEDLEKSKQTWSGQMPEAMDYVDMISNSVRRCRDLIDAWLNLAKSAKKNFKPVALSEVVKESVRVLKHPADMRRVSITCTVPDHCATVFGEQVQLARCIQNLLSNSLDAVEEGRGVIQISCETKDGSVRVLVTDNGCGIDEAHLGKIFEPYFTTKPIDRGTGLGLFITRKIIEDHEGKILVHSKVGEGTTMEILVPCYAEQAVAS